MVKAPERFGLYLPFKRPPNTQSVSDFCLHNINTVTVGDLPARFDWSIIGCTILLLALINLWKIKGGRKKRDRQKQVEKGEREAREKKMSVYFST